jgi:hypothetical protein
MSQLQVNQVKDKGKNKKKETNQTIKHQTVIKNQQNYSNPYQATSILLLVSHERVEIAPLNSIDATTKYVNHTLNVLIIIRSSPGRPATRVQYLYVWSEERKCFSCDKLDDLP